MTQYVIFFEKDRNMLVQAKPIKKNWFPRSWSLYSYKRNLSNWNQLVSEFVLVKTVG